VNTSPTPYRYGVITPHAQIHKSHDLENEIGFHFIINIANLRLLDPCANAGS